MSKEDEEMREARERVSDDMLIPNAVKDTFK